MHDEMKKVDLSDVCQIEKDLISALKTVTAHGVFSKDVDTKELGELVDMVKDMAETKRNCWEACYYETVTEAMKEHDEEDMMRMGYNPNRYANGRYAPSGTGNQTYGYIPYLNSNNVRIPMRPGTLFHDEGLMGYSDGMDIRGYGDRDRSYGYPYGMAFEEYEDARRHYTESNSKEDKYHMDEKALEHVNNSMTTLREIWKNADPMVKKEVSSAITTLASEFKTA